jgi:hypothetical protein
MTEATPPLQHKPPHPPAGGGNPSSPTNFPSDQPSGGASGGAAWFQKMFPGATPDEEAHFIANMLSMISAQMSQEAQDIQNTNQKIKQQIEENG